MDSFHREHVIDVTNAPLKALVCSSSDVTLRAEAPVFPAHAWAEEWACRILETTLGTTGWFRVGEPCGTLRLYSRINDVVENGEC